MPRVCTVCTSSHRSEIEALLNNGAPHRHVARQFERSASAILRHKDHTAKPPKAPDTESGAMPIAASYSPENEPETENGHRLTIKQKLFVEHYLITQNGREAAKLAGYTGDDATLRSMATQNLALPHIRAEIDRRLRPFILSADEVLNLLSRQAHGNIDAFLTKDGQLDLAKARRDGSIRLVKKLRFNKDGHIDSLEIHDAQAAAVHVGRKYKLFTDKVETDSPETREQIDRLAAMVEELMDKFNLSRDQARRIVDQIYNDSDLADSDLATNSVS